MADRLTPKHLTNGERLVLIEQFIQHLDEKVQNNGESAADGIITISTKLDAIDEKWDIRFKGLEHAQRQDKRDLDVLKARGAGVLTAIGVVFTVTATIFADFFAHVKEIVFG